MSGSRASSWRNTTESSRRARWAPRQKWGPGPPNPTWGLGSRRTSKRGSVPRSTVARSEGSTCAKLVLSADAGTGHQEDAVHLRVLRRPAVIAFLGFEQILAFVDDAVMQLGQNEDLRVSHRVGHAPQAIHARHLVGATGVAPGRVDAAGEALFAELSLVAGGPEGGAPPCPVESARRLVLGRPVRKQPLSGRWGES